MGTLTTVRVATKDGRTYTRTHYEPLSEATLLAAGTRMVAEEPDPDGWVIVSLRASLR